MNRLALFQPLCRRVQGLLGYSVRDVLIPTPPEMVGFAAQFSNNEWSRLCENRSFLAVVDKDLSEAGAVASVLLNRTVVV